MEVWDMHLDCCTPSSSSISGPLPPIGVDAMVDRIEHDSMGQESEQDISSLLQEWNSNVLFVLSSALTTWRCILDLQYSTRTRNTIAQIDEGHSRWFCWQSSQELPVNVSGNDLNSRCSRRSLSLTRKGNTANLVLYAQEEEKDV